MAQRAAALTGVAPASGRLRWPAGLRGLALAASLVQLSACASLTLPARADRPPPAVASRPAVQQLANSLTVTSQRGRLDASQRSQLLARLGREGGASLLNRQLLAMTAQDSVQVSTGNSAKLLIDGPATFAAMFEAIENARRSVLLQSYIIEDTAIAQRLAALLERKRAQGLQVVLLYDAAGSIGTAKAFFERLQAAGVPTCATNPVNPLMRPGYWGINQRDHRKILVVDRQTAFTGGINISEVYASGSFGWRGRQVPAAASAASAASATGITGTSRTDSTNRNGPGWRDTQIQLQGPSAAVLEDLVRATWAAQGCVGDLPPPSAAAAGAAAAAASPGQQVVRIVSTSPDDGVSRIYSLLLNAIDASQRSVALTMAYFAPGQDMVDALCDAAQRGVSVQLVLPSKSDFAPLLHAGRNHYSRLLAAGVQIHELQAAVLHAKTAVIDGVLSTVGSSNMDWRSFASNDEVNAVVLGEDFGDSMLRMFGRDVAASETITAAAWRQRPLLQQAKEQLAGLLERLW